MSSAIFSAQSQELFFSNMGLSTDFSIVKYFLSPGTNC